MRGYLKNWKRAYIHLKNGGETLYRRTPCNNMSGAAARTLKKSKKR